MSHRGAQRGDGQRGRGDGQRGRGDGQRGRGDGQRGRGDGQRGRGDGPRGRGGPSGGRPFDSSDQGSVSSAAESRGSFRGGRGGPPRGGPFEQRGGGGGGGGGFRGGRGRGGGGPVIFAANTPATVDARLSTANEASLVAALRGLSITKERPARPGYGTLGTPLTLRANFFPVKVPKGPLYDYSVEVFPTTDIKRIKGRLFELLEQSPQFQPHLGYIAHDKTARLVSAKKLPEPLDVPITFLEEGERTPQQGAAVYTVSIKFVRQLDSSQLTRYLDGQPDSRGYDPLPLISALNLVLQQHASRTGVRVGTNRYFFPSSAEKMSLGFGLDAYKGFYASVRPAYKQLMVNVNVCMTAFFVPGNLGDAMFAFSRGAHGALPTLPKSFAKDIKVTTTYLGYKMKKKLKKIGDKSARQQTFDCAEFGGRISVETYFKKKYNVTLQHAHDLPVVDTGGKREMWVPAELCVIEEGQPYRGKLSDKETAAMIKYACNPPRVNAESIVNEGLPILALTPNTLTAPQNGFGITVGNEMAVIPGRLLPAPSLSYKVGKPNVRDGSWNILDVKFHRGAAVTSWWVMVVRDGQMQFSGPEDPSLRGLVQGFAAKCGRSGMGMPQSIPTLLVTPALPPVQSDPGRIRALDLIRQAIKAKLQPGNAPSFVLVLLSGRDNFIYPGIKRLCDVELGIHTVHMLLSKALGDPKKQDQYFSNVALKVNSKLGGLNHLLDADSMKWLTKKKTMIIGSDVTHPGPGSREGTPSIAAVVASVDNSFVQFPASLRVQEPDPGKQSKEMIDELGEMVVERLLLYEKKNKALPERIIFYRDGVSEGQFDIVIREELPRIRKAFSKLDTKNRGKAYQPTLTIVICGKRHHARFYPTTEPYADRNGNTKPGTVVDKGVTDVYDFDFYLQAHAGLQGTVRPTHYTVVYDENGLGADELQQGTHTASYLYARATKAVSLVPAAYYADLACERGRCYLNDFLILDDKASSAGRSRSDREAEKKRVFNAAKTSWGEGVHPNLRESMFYI